MKIVLLGPASPDTTPSASLRSSPSVFWEKAHRRNPPQR